MEDLDHDLRFLRGVDDRSDDHPQGAEGDQAQ
jgi:hypothetical protein